MYLPPKPGNRTQCTWPGATAVERQRLGAALPTSLLQPHGHRGIVGPLRGAEIWWKQGPTFIQSQNFPNRFEAKFTKPLLHASLILDFFRQFFSKKWQVLRKATHAWCDFGMPSVAARPWASRLRFRIRRSKERICERLPSGVFFESK